MSAARTERLLNLLALLLNARRPISLREIRQMSEFDAYVTSDPKSGERAFERDKAALVELGVPLRWVAPEDEDDLDTTDGLGGYTIDRKRYYLPDLNLSPAEVALLSIAGATAVGVDHFPGRQTVIRALAKIGFDVAESTSSATLSHAPMQAGTDAALVGKHLEVLHDVVARRRRVQMKYHGASSGLTEREVDPYGLYYRQGIWYLVGRCHLRQGERTFHLGRIESVELSHTRQKDAADFEVPESFDLSAHVKRRPWEFPNEEPCEVVIRLAERLVPALREIFGGRVELERRDNQAIVRIQVSHRAALIAAVLPFGAAAEVLEPADLRQEIGAIYAELAQRYASEGAA